MLVSFGTSALSVTKRDTLLRQVQGLSPDVSSVDATFVHLVACKSRAAEEELAVNESTSRRILDKLLSYGDDIRLPSSNESIREVKNLVYVLPRHGSISPWSSKATDIATICDLGEHVERLERGVVYIFTLSTGRGLTQDDLNIFSHLLHDRMTQVVQFSLPKEDDLF